MTIRREAILTELWQRLYTTTGVTRVSRNPDTAVDPDDLPLINMFEREDTILPQGRSMRGGYPAYKRRLLVALEFFYKGTSEESATKELLVFVNAAKKAIFVDGISLGGICEIAEIDATEVIMVEGGDHARAIGIGFEIRYAEDVADAFA